MALKTKMTLAFDPVAPIDLIYTVGMGHCGSTLLNLCLDRHPEIIGVGELSTLNHPKPGWSGSHDVLQNPFWHMVSQNYADSTGHRFDSVPFIFKNGSRFGRTHPLLDQANFQASQSILRVSGRRIIADASKNIDRLRALLKSPHFNVKVIHLVRDARAHLYSYRCKKYTWPGGFKKLMIKDKKIRNLHAEMPQTDWLVVRYEDFATDPRATLAQICAFAGIDFVPDMLHPDTAEFHGIGGNRLRKQPVEAIRVDDRWRREIAPHTLAVLTWMTSRYNQRYGY